MAKTRSPEYPAISLKEAIDRVKMVYGKDYQNRLPKKVIAEHMGYKGLSGASLPIISALTKYGLLDGRGDETRVSDLAVALIAHAPGTPERTAALHTASSLPELFVELDKRFPDGKASDQALRSYLLTSKFIPGAADAAIRSYRDTKQLVDAESGGYIEPVKEPEISPMMPNTHQTGAEKASFAPAAPAKPGMLQEVFNLEEGPVTLMFPASMSEDSFQDLSDRIDIVLRGLKRRAIGQRVTRDALAGVQEALNQPNTARVPFMITQAQKEALRAKGFEDDQIVHMTPEKAHQLLGLLPPLPY